MLPMRLRFARPLLLATLLFFLGVSQTQGQTARVHGTVTDEAGTPIPSVNVILTSLDGEDMIDGTSTSPDGTFSIEGVQPGTYQLVATAIGYEKATTEVTLEGEAHENVSLTVTKKRYGLGEVVVSAARSQETLGSVASSVSVLDPKSLETQRAVTSDLGEVLATEVPGLAPSSGSLSNYGQTLRGRSPFVMIDGVPQNTPLRDAARYLRTVNPEVIERVEVVRGASALYGYGATGGAINIITTEPTPGLEASTEVGIRASGVDLGESFTGRLHQSVAGQSERGVEYVASGSYEQWGQFYDGKGNLIAQDPRGQGGLAGANEYSVLGKAGVPLATAQRLSATVSYYSFLQDMEYAREPGNFNEEPTTAVPLDDPPGKDPGTQNLVGQLKYEHTDLLGGDVTARAYLQDYTTRFGYADFYPNGGGQGVVESTKLGARVDATTPLGTEGSQLLWGLDALRDQTAQPLEDGRTYVPPMTQTSAAPFAQVRLLFGDHVTLRGGGRYEALSLTVDDFTTLFPEIDTDGDGAPDTRNEVGGGTLVYDNTVFNVGVVGTVVDPLDVFASFKQGFSVSDVGRVLRGTAASSAEQISPEAKTVNSYEIGLRLGTPVVNATATGFYNTSDLGSTYGDLPELKIIRSPERIYGVEATADVQVLEAVTVGGTFTWLEGKRDANDDGSYDTYLPGNRIPPAKMTGHVEVTPVAGWTSRLQVMHVGSRDRFDDNVYGHGSIDSYTLVDLSSQIDVGPGALQVGVQNLFDTYYFPVRSQFTNLGRAYTPGRGRNASLSYTVRW